MRAVAGTGASERAPWGTGGPDGTAAPDGGGTPGRTAPGAVAAVLVTGFAPVGAPPRRR